MRVNTIQLNNGYTNPQKYNKIISFTNNTSSELPTVNTTTTPFESLPRKFEVPIVGTHVDRVINAVVDFFKEPAFDPLYSGQVSDVIKFLPYLI